MTTGIPYQYNSKIDQVEKDLGVLGAGTPGREQREMEANKDQLKFLSLISLIVASVMKQERK